MGTEEFWVPAALTALSAAGNYVNQSNANSRQQGIQAQNISEEEALQQRANQQVTGLTKQITQNSPQTLADQLTGSFISNLRKNAVGAQTSLGTTGSPINFGASTSALPANVGGSKRYASDIASSQKQLENYGNQEADLMGNIVAPTLQRQNEGLVMNTLGTNLNLLGAESYTQNFVNQLRSQTAGVQSPWLTFLSGALGGAGNSLSRNPPQGGSAPSGVFGTGGITNPNNPNGPNFGNVGGFSPYYWDAFSTGSAPGGP